MSTPNTVEEAIIARLKSDATITNLVGGRISTQLTDRDDAYPAIVVRRIGADGNNGLKPTDASRKNRRYTIQVDTYAKTETETHAPAAAVVDLLHNKADVARGLGGVFHSDSSADADDQGNRLVSHTFSAWFCRP